MNTAYFDCFSGISGNMILGAFIQVGLEIEDLKEALQTLSLGGYKLEIKRVKKHSINAQYLDVRVIEEQPHRNLGDMKKIIKQSLLPTEVKDLAIKIFHRLAEAESKVHGCSIKEVHFHELGGVDTIIDIVGAAYGVYKLGIKKVYASPLHVGKGMVKCAHGVMPIPAPATLELLKNAITYSQDIAGELVTPTGAAIITTLTDHFGPQPTLKIKKIGYGAGTWDLAIPNVLRLTIGEEVKEEKEDIIMIETNIDDMNPEFYDYLLDRLLENEALDVYLTPLQMKKSRPGSLLTVICEQIHRDKLVEIILQETTTLGIRYYPVSRVKLERRIEIMNTPWGDVRIKIGLQKDGTVLNIKPEYEDCRRIAEKSSMPLKEVWQSIINLYERI